MGVGNVPSKAAGVNKERSRIGSGITDFFVEKVCFVSFF